MSVQMVQAKIKRGSVTDAQAAAKKLFAALSDAQPEEIRYVSYLLPNGETFVALTQLDASLRSLYAEDLRRAFSPERDLGLHWRARDGSSYRWRTSTQPGRSTASGTGARATTAG